MARPAVPDDLSSHARRGDVTNRAMRLLQGAGIAVGVPAVAVITLLTLDRVHAPPVRHDPGVAAVDTSRHSRLIIVVVDSWRYQTATDSTLMPQVAQLRRRGASWKTDGVYEGFTIPAVRAAYTGHAETQLVNVIQNFRFSALPAESFFLDAERAGKRALVVAIEPFQQFGDHYVQRVPEKGNLDLYAIDHLRPGIAMRGYRDEGFDIVVLHYESADWVAHEGGIHTPRYRAEFAYADSMIARFAAALGPDDYLLVHGDHGHNERGEHKTGLYIPTFGLMLGPDVTPGVTLPQLPMTDIRYLASHAMGISLRSAPYDMDLISRIIPVHDSARVMMRAAAPVVDHAPADYAAAIAILIVAVALGWGLPRLAPEPDATPGTLLAVTACFAAELGVVAWGARLASAFPFLLIALGAAAMRPARRARWAGLAVLVLGAWFVWQLGGGPTWGTALREPANLAAIIPLYVAAVGAKFLVLGGDTRTAWRRAAPWTLVLALVEFRVWDHPVTYGAVALAALAFRLRATDAAARRVASIAAIEALVYFTCRLPLFELAWLDLFLGALWLVARTRDDAWRDALIVTGAFTFTSTWLQSGLEWGFLYTLFPAHLVELQVQYFLPFIVAKLPLVLVLALCVAGAAPSRRFVRVLLAYVALRFAAAWAMKMAGASAIDIWPLAEQGAYLSTFAGAALAWGWYRGGTPVMTGARAT